MRDLGFLISSVSQLFYLKHNTLQIKSIKMDARKGLKTLLSSDTLACNCF